MPDERALGTSRTLAGDVEELYEHAPCAHLSTLPDGTIIRANQTFFNWLGAERESVIGQVRFQSLLTMGSRMYYETHYAPLLQMQGSISEIALDIRRADGLVRPVVASAKQVRDVNGVALVSHVALFDSTDRRRYEQELVEARKSAERAARELSEADAQKNAFIAMLAHELRNPLAPIRNAVEILRQTERGNDTTGRTAMMMQRQVSQMVRLVEDLLDASRLGHAKLTVTRVPVDLVSIVRHAVEATESLVADAGLRFYVHVPTVPIYVDADASRLIQVIENVVNNAAKFTPRDGSVDLTVGLAGHRAEIRVRDTGIGIDPSKLSRVFDLFMQGNVSADRQGGLGIGLMLAKNLVEQHEGEITVHSDGVGSGTEFTIRLPVLTQALESVSPSVSTSPLPRAVARKRILVVDDNHDSADMMAILLGILGHEIQTSYDGLQAVEMAEVFQPDVVLLDIGLPSITGYEAAQRIRASRGTQTFLVALTGWGQDEDHHKSAAAGFNAHLVKPVDHEMLAKLIAQLP